MLKPEKKKTEKEILRGKINFSQENNSDLPSLCNLNEVLNIITKRFPGESVIARNTIGKLRSFNPDFIKYAWNSEYSCIEEFLADWIASLLEPSIP